MPHRYKDRDRYGHYWTSHYDRQYTPEPTNNSASEFFAAMIVLPLLLAALVFSTLGLLKLTFVISAPLCALVGAGIALQILIPIAVGALLILATVATVVAISCAISALCSYLSNRSKAKDSATTDQTQTVVAAAVAPSEAISKQVAPKSDPDADAREKCLKTESKARSLINREEKIGFDKILQEYIPILRKQYPAYPRGYGFGVGNCGRQGLGTHGGIGHTMDKENKPLYGFRVYAIDSVQVSRAKALLN